MTPAHRLAPGVHERLVTRAVAEALRELGEDRARLRELGPRDAERLAHLAAQHLARLARRALVPLGPEKAAELIDRAVAALRPGEEGERLAPPPRLLLAVLPEGVPAGAGPARPPGLLPLSETTFLGNQSRELSVLHVLQDELRSADRVDAVIAFLRWSGFVVLREALADFLRDHPGGLRVVTSTYLGATSRRVVDELCRMGAEVRIGWDPRTTPLHAKAWIFHRESGFHTALLGSSNLSHRAVTDGLEWNLRLSAVENPDALERMAVQFERYWEGDDFAPYDPARDGERLDRVLGEAQAEEPRLSTLVEVRPWPFQEEILERLAEERRRGFTRNLLVAPTGTGKTVIAALDYRRLREEERAAGRELRLLFVAHRKEILLQARDTFRHALRDPGFGELLVDGEVPVRWTHVFASVQSLVRRIPGEIAPDRFGMVIVDEIHHAAARTWDTVLEHFAPRWLLGLTATPERADGRSILPYFGGRIAAEMRLWHALERQLVAPFRYFVIEDGTDLRTVRWRGGRFVDSDLDRLYTGHHARARKILEAVARYVEAPTRMRALGYCVSQAHARFMARRFSEAGLPARAVTAETGAAERAEALAALRDGRLRALFSVDLFNEGLDVPAVDTLLFLRPTESATVFLQQLGRGLRRAAGKDAVLVLDFVGQVDRRFRFDRRFRALVGGTRREVLAEVEAGFPTLPPACAIVLEERAREIVLRNIRENLRRAGTRELLEELGAAVAEPGRLELRTFLERAGLELEDVYDRRRACWTSLLRRAGHLPREAPPREEDWYDLPGRLLHLDDPERLATWRRVLAGWRPAGDAAADDPDWRRLGMVGVMLEDARGRRFALPLHEHPRLVDELLAHEPLARELRELVAILSRRPRDPRPPVPGTDLLALHGTYARREILAALGVTGSDGSIRRPREGVILAGEGGPLLLFVTLEKGEGFTERTRYDDYPISRVRFHWQSQASTRWDSEKGRLIREHEAMGLDVLLFVRRRQKDDLGRAMPFTCLGRVFHEESHGERPISVTWRLEHPMPVALFDAA